VDWLQHFSQIGSGTGGIASAFIAKRTDIITNNHVPDVRNNDIATPFGPTTGLNVYGQITSALDTFVTLLETTNHFKVLSRPSVFVLNNRKATILSGQSIPVPTQTLTNASSSTTANSGNVTTTIDYKDVVLKLEVIPLIDPEGELTLTLAQTNDTVVGNQTIAQNSVPIVGTEKLSTTVTVPNGNTVVLGGLIAEQYKKDTSGVPYISRIPVLGNFFKQNTTSKERKELIIFIQPRITLDDGVIRDASLHEDLRTRVGEDAARTFPDKVVPVATPVEPKKKKKNFFQRIFGGSSSDNSTQTK
jgi:type II secretory pathway component GspD/PulD (secretin)